MDEKPLVSVIITNYNYVDYVAEAIESALGQTYKNIEVIVVNDGSTDNSLEVINRYAKRVRVITRKNRGVVYTRNEAIELSKGEFFLQLDADDHIGSEYVKTLVKTAVQTKADIVYTDYKKFGATEEISSFPDFNIEILKNQNFIHISSLVRKSALKGVRFDENLSGMTHEDWDFFLALCVNGAKAIKNESVYLNYRIHNTGSRNNLQQSNAERKKYLDVYAYVIRKHISDNTKGFDYLTGPVFSDWYAQLYQDYNQEKHELELTIKRNEKHYTLEIDSLRREKEDILSSRAYHIGRTMLLPVRAGKRSLRRAHSALRQAYQWREAMSIDSAYEKQLQDITSSLSREGVDKKIAVVIHLFYLENWPLFKRKLNLLPRKKFDLYITMPEQNGHFISTIEEDFSDVRVVISPNRGRDVLPFMMVLQAIIENSYNAVLKFHSKKSTHWDGGQGWLETMLDEIIPEDKDTLDRIIALAEKGDFGVIGPKSVYYPLTVNYPANAAHLTKILTDLYHEGKAKDVTNHRSEYGFFGGTMFWMGTGSLKKLATYASAKYFEEEAGQVDGTFAHAIERILSITPQLDGLAMYETDGKSIAGRASKTSNIPEWSEDHDK